MTVPVIAFVGHHNAGKTVVLEKVIDRLTSEGLRVGSIKHHGERDRDFDVPDSDAAFHASAGSAHTITVGPHYITDFHLVEREPSVEEVIARLDDVDIILAEGYKHAGLPSFAIARSATDSVGTLMALINSSTVAVICDEPLASFAPKGLPRFDLDDVEGIVAMVHRIA